MRGSFMVSRASPRREWLMLRVLPGPDGLRMRLELTPKEAAANLASNTANAGKGAAGLAHTATGAIAEVVTETARRILPSSAASEGEGRHVDHIAGNGGKKKRKDRPEPRREH